MLQEPIFEERRRTIDEGRDAPGGWTKDRLASWGVPWPPPIGWAKQLVMHGFPYKPPSDTSSE